LVAPLADRKVKRDRNGPEPARPPSSLESDHRRLPCHPGSAEHLDQAHHQQPIRTSARSSLTPANHDWLAHNFNFNDHWLADDNVDVNHDLNNHYHHDIYNDYHHTVPD
jgi:hypothetical protein